MQSLAKSSHNLPEPVSAKNGVHCVSVRDVQAIVIGVPKSAEKRPPPPPLFVATLVNEIFLIGVVEISFQPQIRLTLSNK